MLRPVNGRCAGFAAVGIRFIICLPHALYTYQTQGRFLLQLYLHYSWTLATFDGTTIIFNRRCLYDTPVPFLRGQANTSVSQPRARGGTTIRRDVQFPERTFWS